MNRSYRSLLLTPICGTFPFKCKLWLDFNPSSLVCPKASSNWRMSWFMRRATLRSCGLKSSPRLISCSKSNLLRRSASGSQQDGDKQGSLSHLHQSLNSRLSQPLPQSPDLQVYEPFWAHFWEEEQLFKPRPVGAAKDGSIEEVGGSGPRFSMILPPPNVTGNLHLGHAMTVSLQDAIYRWNRMKGRACLWVPGYDHAGIATQLVLDKVLSAQRGVRVRDMPAQEFHEFAEQWRDSRISDIRKQMKKLGASLDFSREFYTLSPAMSESVKEAFIRLFEDGLIYRETTLVNWSFFLKSTLSDIEIDWVPMKGPTKLTVPGSDEQVEFGLLHSFSYPLADDMSGKDIVISTTRLETLLGDVAIAVHPNDERYSGLIGRHVFHPITGQKLPIIADERIDVNFGSGAMKVTPALSFVDYEIGRDHKLPTVTIFDENGCIKCTHLRKEFQSLNGITRFQAKKKVEEVLNRLGLYRGCKDHATVVPVCSRSGDVIEANLLPQWFVNSKVLGVQSSLAVTSGELKLVPDNYAKLWHKWSTDRDWCISRQILWGHRIPAYQVISSASSDEATNIWVAAKSQEEAISKAAKKLGLSTESVKVVQDKDVLDTWFSSALLPFTALGWPNNSTAYKQFYPLSLMETGFDILGFWVSRMVLLSKHLTGKLPFNEVLLHGMVCDAHGKKMTKSLGNVIDPLDVINGVTLDQLLVKSQDHHKNGFLTEKQLESALKGQKSLFPEGIPECGSDALRLSLYQNDCQKDMIKLGISNITHNKHFINKMWQTFRFFEMASSEVGKNHVWLKDIEDLDYFADSMRSQLSAIDSWILSCVASFVALSNDSMAKYQFSALYSGLHRLWIEKMCDVYLESIKPLIRGKERDETSLSISLNVLKICLKTTLKCTHPMMPFVSEELFQRLKIVSDERSLEIESILLEKYPSPEVWMKWKDASLEDDMRIVDVSLNKLRSIKKEYKMSPKDESELSVVVETPDDRLESIGKLVAVINNMSRNQPISVVGSTSRTTEGKLNWINFDLGADITLSVKPSVKLINHKISDIKRKTEKVETELKKLETKGSNSKRTREKRETLQTQLKSLNEEEHKMKDMERQFTEKALDSKTGTKNRVEKSG